MPVLRFGLFCLFRNGKTVKKRKQQNIQVFHSVIKIIFFFLGSFFLPISKLGLSIGVRMNFRRLKKIPP